MLSEDVKYRLSVAFNFTRDNIRICQDIVIESSIHSTEKSNILGDLADVSNIMKQEKFEDVDAIEEAMVALSEMYTSVGKLHDGRRLRESLGHILEWLEYIKKTLGYEGLIPSGMRDIHSGSHTIQQTKTAQSDYYYLDDSGNFMPTGSMEGNSHSEWQDLNYFPHF